MSPHSTTNAASLNVCRQYREMIMDGMVGLYISRKYKKKSGFIYQKDLSVVLYV
jgi:hypothetical protein